MPVEDLGQKNYYQIMNQKMKRHYQVPSIKVVSFIVEGGFQATTQNIGIGIQEGQTINPEPDPFPSVTQGTENYGIRSL